MRRTYESRLQIRICNINRKAECGEIYFDELSDRSEDCHNIQQTTDYKKPHSDGTYN